jgi:hypothetical protein
MRVSFAAVKDGGFWDEETVDVPDERCGTEADAVHWFVLEHCAEEPNIITAAVLCMPADELGRTDDTRIVQGCIHCGQDIEGNQEGGWRDRGNGEHCLPFIRRGELVTPPEDQRHAVEDDTPPPCAQAMGCLCAAHAKGRASEGPCDTNEGCDPDSW